MTLTALSSTTNTVNTPNNTCVDCAAKPAMNETSYCRMRRLQERNWMKMLTVATIRVFLEICSTIFWPSKSCKYEQNYFSTRVGLTNGKYTHDLPLKILLQDVCHVSKTLQKM